MVVVEPKGKKEGTKGQKQIAKDNAETLRFYTIMVAVGNVFHIIGHLLFGLNGVGLMIVFSMTLGMQIFCLTVMKFMGKPMLSDTGALLDAGIDLNMKNGNAEYLKDFLILTTVIEVLTVVTSYFWWLLISVPLYISGLVWINILAPWFFAAAPEEEEISEKKQKKLDRKMRRQQGR